MIRSVRSVSLGATLIAALFFGSTGCRSRSEASLRLRDDGSLDLRALEAGMSESRVQAICAQLPYRLVPADENLAPDGRPAPGVRYLADICPDCGGVRDVLCTLYFDGNDRLLRWHEGWVEDDPRRATIDGEPLRPGMSVAEAKALFQAHGLVAVDEEHAPDGTAVPGAYYVADVCPDCGGCQTIFGTLYFDEEGKLVRWHGEDMETEADTQAAR